MTDGYEPGGRFEIALPVGEIMNRLDACREQLDAARAEAARLRDLLQSRRCDTCKRWDPEEDKPGWGICHAACGKHGKPYDHDHTDTPLYATAKNAGSWEEQLDEWCIYSHLHTKADFGCVIWEAGDAE